MSTSDIVTVNHLNFTVTFIVIDELILMHQRYGSFHYMALTRCNVAVNVQVNFPYSVEWDQATSNQIKACQIVK